MKLIRSSNRKLWPLRKVRRWWGFGLSRQTVDVVPTFAC
jgi:hypothetical protein